MKIYLRLKINAALLYYHTRSAVSDESAVFDVGSGDVSGVSGYTTTTSFDKSCVEIYRQARYQYVDL